jgi:hypothetical protein
LLFEKIVFVVTFVVVVVACDVQGPKMQCLPTVVLPLGVVLRVVPEVIILYCGAGDVVVFVVARSVCGLLSIFDV